MPGPRIVLVRTKDSANVGGAARAMKNFGLTDLWLVSPRCRIDERARSLASHAEDILESAVVVAELEEALVGKRLVLGTSARSRRSPSYVTAAPREMGASLDADAAVLFGPEDHGLANDELTRCQAQIVIPTDEFSSLNLAQAVLVVAYESHLARTGHASKPVGSQPTPDGTPNLPGSAGTGSPRGRTGEDAPSRDQVERFYAQFEDALLRIGYTDQRRAPSVMRMLRAVFDRAELSAHELAALRGLASQIRWAADQPPSRLPAGGGELSD